MPWTQQRWQLMQRHAETATVTDALPLLQYRSFGWQQVLRRLRIAVALDLQKLW
jgi:hypothetical protein